MDYSKQKGNYFPGASRKIMKQEEQEKRTFMPFRVHSSQLGVYAYMLRGASIMAIVFNILNLTSIHIDDYYERLN